MCVDSPLFLLASANSLQVFLLDDASSMQQHWDNVVTLADILAYIVKRTDEDGVDLHFTICKNLRRNEKKTTDLIDFVEDNRPDPPETGAERLSNIDYCLGSILHEYQEKLEKDRQRIRRSGKNSRFSSAPKPVRKLNLYVLTDGLWQPEANGIAPLRALVSTLDRLKKPADQVGIQFIQFGNEEEGTKSLSYLDSDLVKLQSFTRLAWLLPVAVIRVKILISPGILSILSRLTGGISGKCFLELLTDGLTATTRRYRPVQVPHSMMPVHSILRRHTDEQFLCLWSHVVDGDTGCI